MQLEAGGTRAKRVDGVVVLRKGNTVSCRTFKFSFNSRAAFPGLGTGCPTICESILDVLANTFCPGSTHIVGEVLQKSCFRQDCQSPFRRTNVAHEHAHQVEPTHEAGVSKYDRVYHRGEAYQYTLLPCRPSYTCNDYGIQRSYYSTSIVHNRTT